jgi:hypothetical protein
MKRRLSVTVEEVIGIIDETMTAGMTTTRTDPKPLRQCLQFLPSECKTPSHFLSRMVCPLCLLDSASRVRQQHSLQHPDTAARLP